MKKHKIYYIEEQTTKQRLGTTTFDINGAYAEKDKFAKTNLQLEVKEVIKPAIVKVDLHNSEIENIEDKLFTDTKSIVKEVVKEVIKKVKKKTNKKKTSKKKK